MRPCNSPYCECPAGTCSHPGCYDDRHYPPRQWASMGVMCGGDADATAAQNVQDRLDALPRMPREYLELSPRDRATLASMSRRELFERMANGVTFEPVAVLGD